MTTPSRKRTEDLIIVSKQLYDSGHLFLQLQASEPYPEVLPGQFVQARVDHSKEVFLRRPLSVHDWDRKKGLLSLWIKIVGKGTKAISDLEPGNIFNLIWPLGNSFVMPAVSNPLLVGGGCGAAPLLYLARFMKESGMHPRILLGARTASEFFNLDTYSSFGELYLMTEDGSKGEKGFVTAHQLLKSEIHSLGHIIACGPDLMMKAVGKLAIENQIPCQVSLENMMACGIGVCLCCVVKTNNGHVCTCTEGPVFDVTQLNSWIEK